MHKNNWVFDAQMRGLMARQELREGKIQEINTSEKATYYDYANQAWIRNGKYIRCGHPENMNCGCYGRTHEGEQVGAGK